MNSPELKVIRPVRKAITSKLQQKLERATRRMLSIQKEIAVRSQVGQFIQLPKCPNVPKTLWDNIAEYFQNNKLSKKTENDRRVVLHRFAGVVGARPLSREVVEEWIRLQHKSSRADSTKAKESMDVAVFLKWLHESGRTPEYWHKGVKVIPAPPQQPRRPYTKLEYQRIVEVAEEQLSTRHIGFIVKLGWHTGMALVDCCDLEWKHIDVDGCTITRPRTKTGQEAIIAYEFGGELDRAIRAQREEAIAVYDKATGILPVCRQAHRNKTNVSRLFKQVVEKAGIPYRSFHSWRGTFISHLVKSGTNLAVGMKMTGIKDPEVFAKYATVDAETIRKAVCGIR
jgi:integrase